LKADVRELKQDMLEVKDNLRQILLILKKGWFEQKTFKSF
jgi:hypothetical protein